MTSRVPLLGIPALFALLGCLVVSLAAQTVPATSPTPAAKGDEVYRPPARPLDERIAGDRITVRADLPALPQDVLLPLPPDHRIAAGPRESTLDAERWHRARAALARGIAFLEGAQREDGAWMPGAAAPPTDDPDAPAPVSIAITALAVKALAQAEGRLGGGVDDAAATERVRRGLAYIDRGRGDDGAYGAGALSNYVTSAVVSALTATDAFRHRDRIASAASWLQAGQWDQGEGLDPKQDWFGGAGYGNRGRPDLSNTQMMLDALYDAGMSPAEPAFQRALAFTSRTQNLTATNDAEWAGDDGGFVYTPANGGESMASEAAGEGRYGEKLPAGAPRSLRSYGSMTYAGFKSMLFAGLAPDDVRVRAAFDWVRRHWTFDENPGLGAQGLYYYYHTMARALRVAQQDVITDADGVAHDWRAELVDAVLARQRDDGSWRNDADRWLEGEPVMATVYAVLALEEAMKPVSSATFGAEDDAKAPPRDGEGDDMPAARRRPAPQDAADDAAPAPADVPVQFGISFEPSVTGIYNGRVYVLLSSSGREPRFGPGWFSSEPFFACDAKNWPADIPLIQGSWDMLRFPADRRGVSPGTYKAQAVMRLNPDSPKLGTGPGNAYSDVVEFEVKSPGQGGMETPEVALRVRHVVPETTFRETDRMKLVEEESAVLSAFHGRPITMRAAVVLPTGYDDDPERRYPTSYYIGGFGADHHAARRMHRRWDRAPGADSIVRVVLDPSCYGGHHVFADSANNGPRGRALVEEMIPHLEKTYRLVPSAHARFVGGHSSGGWSSLWLQVTYPDTFGGVWSTAPDPVDFAAFQNVDVYRHDANAYVDAAGAPIAVAQMRGGTYALRDFIAMEQVYGEGGQMRSFEWVFSPRGPDGLPMPLFDRTTGAIDPFVAASWRRYDIRRILERNWKALGPRLEHKLHVIIGDADTFYLHHAVVRLKQTLEDLGSDAVVEILPGHDHGSFMNQDMIDRIDLEMLEAFRQG